MYMYFDCSFRWINVLNNSVRLAIYSNADSTFRWCFFSIHFSGKLICQPTATDSNEISGNHVAYPGTDQVLRWGKSVNSFPRGDPEMIEICGMTL